MHAPVISGAEGDVARAGHRHVADAFEPLDDPRPVGGVGVVDRRQHQVGDVAGDQDVGELARGLRAGAGDLLAGERLVVRHAGLAFLAELLVATKVTFTAARHGKRSAVEITGQDPGEHVGGVLRHIEVEDLGEVALTGGGRQDVDHAAATDEQEQEVILVGLELLRSHGVLVAADACAGGLHLGRDRVALCRQLVLGHLVGLTVVVAERNTDLLAGEVSTGVCPVDELLEQHVLIGAQREVRRSVGHERTGGHGVDVDHRDVEP